MSDAGDSDGEEDTQCTLANVRVFFFWAIFSSHLSLFLSEQLLKNSTCEVWCAYLVVCASATLCVSIAYQLNVSPIKRIVSPYSPPAVVDKYKVAAEIANSASPTFIFFPHFFFHNPQP
jgi:hypothetical protein